MSTVTIQMPESLAQQIRRRHVRCCRTDVPGFQLYIESKAREAIANSFSDTTVKRFEFSNSMFHQVTASMLMWSGRAVPPGGGARNVRRCHRKSLDVTEFRSFERSLSDQSLSQMSAASKM